MGNTWNGKGRSLMGRRPVIDLAECTDCESCLSLAPSIFTRNEETGCIEIAEAKEYPEAVLQEVVSVCPGHCIEWDDSGK
jgi:ferredoxin